MAQGERLGIRRRKTTTGRKTGQARQTEKPKTEAKPLIEKIPVEKTTPHRDVTISVDDRNAIATLTGWLIKRGNIPAGHRDEWLGALETVVAKWDGNDATEIEA